jgi:hypothetical protein
MKSTKITNERAGDIAKRLVASMPPVDTKPWAVALQKVQHEMDVLCAGVLTELTTGATALKARDARKLLVQLGCMNAAGGGTYQRTIDVLSGTTAVPRLQLPTRVPAEVEVGRVFGANCYVNALIKALNLDTQPLRQAIVDANSVADELAAALTERTSLTESIVRTLAGRGYKQALTLYPELAAYIQPPASNHAVAVVGPADLEDLRKAAWYVNREIQRREKLALLDVALLDGEEELG